jgi:dTMP kinase
MNSIHSVRGKLITIEGIDGAGKSSHLPTIVAWVKARGYACLQTREPGGTALGEQLRHIVLHQTMSPLAELLLVFAARAEHIAQVIEPALSRGDWVVCDRFTDSTFAYQGGGRGMSIEVLEQLAALLTKQAQQPHYEPDLTLIFDIDIAVAKARMHARQFATDTASDKFESAPDSFALAVQQAYRTIAINNPKRCVLIDAAQPLETVQQQVFNTLSTFDFTSATHNV